MNTVPKRLNRAVVAFCRTISTARPVFIRSKPTPAANFGECFENVAQKIAIDGGSIVYGWAIWHYPNLYFEAEHHGVWLARPGKMIDVSPRSFPTSQILFLPHPEAAYDPNLFRPNIFKPANEGPIATEFVELARQRNTIRDRYREKGLRHLLFSPADQSEIECIERRLRELAGSIAPAGF